MQHLLIESIEHALMIAVFVFTMMVLVDYLNVLSHGKMNKIIKGSNFRQYSIASFLGSLPGCLGSFTNVSFYVHGLIGFGAIAGGMIATSGDEAFVMLAMFPKKALLLFTILFILGIIGAWIADQLVRIFKIKTQARCDESVIHKEEHLCTSFKSIQKITLRRLIAISFLIIAIILIASGIIGHTESWGWENITLIILLFVVLFIFITVPEHYLKEHIWKHIIKKHLLKVFLWSLFAILFVHIGLEHFDIESMAKGNMLWIMLIAVLVGIIPESGPHYIFVMMFAQGLIPFSVLLASSIVQDGHGMLPLFSYSIKDSMLIKLFNVVFALLIGGGFYLIGL